MEGYQVNLDTLEEFFTRCATRKAVTEEARMVIMRELVKELRAVKLTERDLEKRLRGKKVLKIESKGEQK